MLRLLMLYQDVGTGCCEQTFVAGKTLVGCQLVASYSIFFQLAIVHVGMGFNMSLEKYSLCSYVVTLCTGKTIFIARFLLWWLLTENFFRLVPVTLVSF